MLACSAPSPAAASSCLPSPGPPRCLQPQAAPRGWHRLPGGRDPPSSSPQGFCFRAVRAFSSHRVSGCGSPGEHQESWHCTASSTGLLLSWDPSRAAQGYCSAGTPAETVASALATGLGKQCDALRLQYPHVHGPAAPRRPSMATSLCNRITES